MKTGILKSILLIFCCLCLVGCNNSADTSKNTSSKNKGTRENPYKVGESVIIKNAYTPDYWEKDAANIPYTIELKINKMLAPGEGLALMERKYDTFFLIPIAELTFSVQGDYSDSIAFNHLINLSSVTNEMEIEGARCTDEECHGLDEFFTNVTYEKYLAVSYDKNESKNYKYLKIEYYNDAEGLNTESVYVLLEDMKNEDNSESVEKQQQEENTASSNEESKYNNALAAEEKLQYTYAKRLYSELNGYKDSHEKMNDMIEILSKYNGTYYGESLKFDNVNVYMYVKDGTVRFKFDSSNVDISESIYEIYGAELDESLHEDTVIVGNQRVSDYSNPSENYIWIPQDNGTVMIAAWTENSIGNSWNGTYSKISDSVDIQ